MTANELADELTKMFRGEEYDRLIHEIPDMLRQQAQEIAMLKQIIDANNLQLNIGQLKKELALQRLSDFSQEIEDRESAIYATGYWKGVEYKRMRELTDAEIMEIYDRVELYNIDEGQMYLKPIEFAKELLKKASSEK